MNRRYILTTAAQDDICAIGEQLNQRSGDAAERFFDAVSQRFKTLANFPTMGRRRDEIAPMLRSFPVENYLIFYRSVDSTTEILRVLAGYSDLEFLFQD